ncbi:MAG TPA: peptidylprolyl isomerase [Pyrinomonadaceae bacterium]|nr:peptidylprolyl isomerase [Pyrinomonadaceae bacterium]
MIDRFLLSRKIVPPLLALLLFVCFSAGTRAAKVRRPAANDENTFTNILRAEDERRCDDALLRLFLSPSVEVRRCTALAAGRIGDERAIEPLAALLAGDREEGVRATAAFALGEIESLKGAAALTGALGRDGETARVRARAVEALGKISAASSSGGSGNQTNKAASPELQSVNAEIARTLAQTGAYGAGGEEREVALAAVTAALRARLTASSKDVAVFLKHPDARLRADAANTLARLRARDVNAPLEAALADSDPVVRANAARALGAAEDQDAFAALSRTLDADDDERVRVSCIRSLAALGDSRAIEPLLARAASLKRSGGRPKSRTSPRLSPINELLEIAAALGRLAANSQNARIAEDLRSLRFAEGGRAPEIEIALARVAPAQYLAELPFDESDGERALATFSRDWRRVSALALGLGEIAALKAEGGNSATKQLPQLRAQAGRVLLKLINHQGVAPLAVPDLLRAYAALKTADAGPVLRAQLRATDVIVRATAAELLGELPPSPMITESLSSALAAARRDKMNDATLAILDALGKQKNPAANAALLSALDSPDHLVRRRAVALLQANNDGDFSSKIGTVQTGHTPLDYRRALERARRVVSAQVVTDKGCFTVELLPAAAPLTVDSFVRLARGGFFDNLTFHRVVPNFVIQGGDPRGDGNGGPGYQIRCEINEVPYERGAVGMALSGKDTGGSQWFVTHSPQPHLDGGYTVFGRVTRGLEVIDAVARGDRIRRVIITERPLSVKR